MYKYPKYLEKGMKFGRLTILKVDGKSKVNKETRSSEWKYICKCDCGKICSKKRYDLLTEEVKSCGCLVLEISAENGKHNKKINLIEDYGEYTKIFFFNCNKHTVIDKEDYDKVKDHCWSYDKGYAISSRNGVSFSLHRLVLEVEEGFLVDHKDQDTLNNRKQNLRECDHSKNAMNTKLYKNNTSGQKGVYYHKSKNRWKAEITCRGKKYHLGSFHNIEDAIQARIIGEEKYHEEFRSQEYKEGL